MDQQAVATYYVLYRLTQQGFAASPTTGGQADLLACTEDGRRVVLLRVRTRDGSRWNMSAGDRRPAGRNVAYAFVDFDARGEPSAFVLRGALVSALLDADPSFPRGLDAFAALEDCREAWHLLGLTGHSSPRSQGSVSSSPVL